MKLFSACILLLCCTVCFAQADSALVTASSNNHDSITYTIANIKLQGNKKTKSYIVFREVTFKVGDSFTPHELTKQLQRTHDLLMNTTLFVDVIVSVSSLIKNQAEITIEVKERWYLFPLPYFKLIDRNFNQWINEQKASLDRVNYGLKFFHNNVSGRNDKVSLDLVNGYNQQISFGYTQPFADKTLTKGFSIGFNYSRQRELNYGTVNNKQAFYKQPDFVRDIFRAAIAYSYRPDTRYRYNFRLGYTRDQVDDTIAKLNPQFFPLGKTEYNFLEVSANMQYYNVDYIPFPKKGFMYEINISNRGFQKDRNIFVLGLEATKAISFNKNTFVQFHNLASIRMPFDQSFYNSGLLGYGDVYLRGLENYVVDGTIGLLSNTTIYQKLFTYVFKLPFKSKTHDKIPFTFYLKAFGDMGYAYSKYQLPTNTLTNSFLRTAGMGLDVVSIYDFVFRMEYSVNQFGNTGFAVRVKGDF